jgi:hypothetical protein
MAMLCAARLVAAEIPTSIEVIIEPPKFGDVASILKVDSTVATFKLDQPVTHLALVLEASPKEPRVVPVARLALELARPVTEGRFCVQMADQGFLPLGNGAPHQMQLFMQLDCGGSIISSSQSFLKEKFSFSKSVVRPGGGTTVRKVTGHRAPVFWLMGNSDRGTYFNDDDLDKMIAKNANDAYILIAYLEIAKEGSVPALVLAGGSKSASSTSAASLSPTLAVVSPPSGASQKEEIKPAVAAKSSSSSSGGSGSSKAASSKKKKKRS